MQIMVYSRTLLKKLRTVRMQILYFRTILITRKKLELLKMKSLTIRLRI